MMKTSNFYSSTEANTQGRGIIIKCFKKHESACGIPPFGFPYDHRFSIERRQGLQKYFEVMHGKKNYPYVGYGHQLLPDERFSSDMLEWQADSLLRSDLMKRFDIFKKYGKDALLLAVLSYNVGVGRILDYGKHAKSQLLHKIEAGERNFYKEFIGFCKYKDVILHGLIKRRFVEFKLFFP